MRAEQSASALPPKSDVNLFCYREGVVDLDAEISDGSLDLSAPEGAARLADYRFDGKSKLPRSGEWNASRTGSGPVQCQRSSEIAGGHTGGSSCVQSAAGQ